MMRISLIAAMDECGLIGTDQGLPWKIPSDLKRFRQATMGKPIIMGRKTHELIGKQLDGRLNIVLTRQKDYQPASGCRAAHSVEEALRVARADSPSVEVMVVGGCEVYRAFLPYCHDFYLTTVKGRFVGTTHFPLSDYSKLEVLNLSIECHGGCKDEPEYVFTHSQAKHPRPVAKTRWLSGVIEKLETSFRSLIRSPRHA